MNDSEIMEIWIYQFSSGKFQIEKSNGRGKIETEDFDTKEQALKRLDKIKENWPQ